MTTKDSEVPKWMTSSSPLQPGQEPGILKQRYCGLFSCQEVLDLCIKFKVGSGHVYIPAVDQLTILFSFQWTNSRLGTEDPSKT